MLADFIYVKGILILLSESLEFQTSRIFVMYISPYINDSLPNKLILVFFYIDL